MKSRYLRGKWLGLWIALLVGAFLISQAIIFFNDLNTQYGGVDINDRLVGEQIHRRPAVAGPRHDQPQRSGG